MTTFEIWEEILWIMKGLSVQRSILFGVQARTLMTCSNLLTEEFCHLCPCSNMKALPDSFGNLTNLQHMIHFFGNFANPQTHGFVRLLQFRIVLETNLASFLKVFAPKSPDHGGGSIANNSVVVLLLRTGVSDLQNLQDCNK